MLKQNSDLGARPDPLLSGAVCDAAEARRHCAEIESIASDLHCPYADVAVLYNATLAMLGARASVRNYLPMLVGRHVRESMHHKLLQNISPM
jgi:hypothetical protein